MIWKLRLYREGMFRQGSLVRAPSGVVTPKASSALLHQVPPLTPASLPELLPLHLTPTLLWCPILTTRLLGRLALHNTHFCRFFVSLWAGGIPIVQTKKVKAKEASGILSNTCEASDLGDIKHLKASRHPHTGEQGLSQSWKAHRIF